MKKPQPERIAIPRDLIPNDYIGEKFGVMLVFIKGKDQAVIDAKAKRLRELALTLAEFDKDNVVVSTANQLIDDN